MTKTIDELRIEASEAKAYSLFIFDSAGAHSAEYKEARHRYERIAKRLADLVHARDMRDAKIKEADAPKLGKEAIAQHFLLAALRARGVVDASDAVHGAEAALQDIGVKISASVLLQSDKAARAFFLARIIDGEGGYDALAETICAVPSFAKVCGVSVHDVPKA